MFGRKEFRCADIVQRFHQGKADADRDGRARQRHRNLEESRASGNAKRACRFKQVARLREEHGAHGNIDIGKQHETEQDDAARHGPYVRQAEFTRAGIAQQPADRPRTGPIGCRISR